MKNALTRTKEDLQNYISSLPTATIANVIDYKGTPADVRGWMMDELEKRNPDVFDEWLDAEYDANHPERIKASYYFK